MLSSDQSERLITALLIVLPGLLLAALLMGLSAALFRRKKQQ